jgi:hypothetical protein
LANFGEFEPNIPKKKKKRDEHQKSQQQQEEHVANRKFASQLIVAMSLDNFLAQQLVGKVSTTQY